MEIMVDRMLPQVLDGYEHICKCSECIDDMKALALNNLKPLYVTTTAGGVFAKLNEMHEQFNTDVITQLMESVGIVSENPHR